MPSGVVNETVQASEFFDGKIDHSANFFLFGHVTSDEGHLACVGVWQRTQLVNQATKIFTPDASMFPFVSSSLTT